MISNKGRKRGGSGLVVDYVITSAFAQRARRETDVWYDRASHINLRKLNIHERELIK